MVECPDCDDSECEHMDEGEQCCICWGAQRDETCAPCFERRL